MGVFLAPVGAGGGWGTRRELGVPSMAQDGGQRDHAGFGEHGVEAVAPGYGDPHDVPPDAEAMAPLSDEHAHHAHMHVPDSLADAAKDLQEDAAKKVRGGVAHCLACVPCVRACARAALCGLRPSPPPRAAALCDRGGAPRVARARRVQTGRRPSWTSMRWGACRSPCWASRGHCPSTAGRRSSLPCSAGTAKCQPSATSARGACTASSARSAATATRLRGAGARTTSASTTAISAAGARTTG